MMDRIGHLILGSNALPILIEARVCQPWVVVIGGNVVPNRGR